MQLDGMATPVIEYLKNTVNTDWPHRKTMLCDFTCFEFLLWLLCFLEILKY